MSLVTLIRDYVDVAHSSEQLNGSTLSSLSSLAYYTFTFFFTIFKQAIVYCFTFQWFRDLSYICLTPPSLLSSFTNFGNIDGTATVAHVSQAQHQPLSNLLAFSDSNFSIGIETIFFAFLNGCFSCFHLSAANLITIQRMLVQGIPAGLCSAFGTAIGQISFLACIFFGFRGLLFPWLALEPLHFVLGIVILLTLASAAAQDRRTPTVQWSSKSSLLIYAFTSFVLTWCEQTAILQWMGNISFGVEPTFLETTPSIETINSIFGNVQQLTKNLGYLIAFFLGNIVGASFFGYSFQRLLEWILRSRGVAIYYGLVKQANLPLATLVFAFGFGSLPYYGFDFLITKGFGFVPNEHLFQQTLFSPINLVSKTSQGKEPSQGRLEDQLALLFTLEGEKTKSFAVDTTPFDDGQYLKASQKRPQAFEDLNYRGEHLWTNRLARISNIREQANQTQSSFLGPIFSWMRSFLWGDGPTAINTANIPTSDRIVQDTRHTPSVPSVSERMPLTSDQYTEYTNQTSTTPEVREKLLVDTIKQKAEITFEKEQADNYIREFDRHFDKGFSNFYNADPQSLIEIEDQWQEKRIKEKCYTNPIYKFLLNTEIDAFLTRQPKSYLLSPQDEALLLKRRQLLSNYYDTLALTSQISTSELLGQLLPPLMGPKSYSNAIYNHQFKGTLKVARRLFSLKKANENNSSNTKSKDVSHTTTLPIYPTQGGNSGLGGNSELLASRIKQATDSTPHENSGTNSMSRSEGKEMVRKQDQRRYGDEKVRRVVKFDQPLFSNEKKNIQQIVFHEELSTKPNQKQDISTEQSPSLDTGTIPKENMPNHTGEKSPNIFLLEQAEPFPLYTSWDQGLRKLILTNRYQSRTIAGYAISKYPTNNSSATDFTIWPIPNPLSTKKKFVHTVESELNNSIESNRVKKSEDLFQNDSKVNTHFQPFKSEKDNNKSLLIDNLLKTQNFKNRFLFQSNSLKEPATTDMINALLQWQKIIKENKQLSKEDKQAAKEKVSYWPENISRASWSNELTDNDIEFDEPNENTLQKQSFLWEFTSPNHGGFFWPGNFGNK